MRIVFPAVIFLLCVSVTAFSQDPHFSQFYASPLTLNPAFIGKFNGVLRLAGNYRNQWPTINRAYQTGTLSADFHIFQNAIDYTDTWGVGLMGFTDKSADGALTYNYISAGTAFHKGLDEDGYKQLGVGFQLTYASFNLNTSKLKFEDQLTNSGFTNPTQELFNNATLKNSYLDINAGILYTMSNTDRNNYYVGISAYHITRPKQQFTGTLYLLEPRFTFQGGGFFGVGERFTLHVSGLHSLQAKAHETLLGGALEIPVTSEENSQAAVNFYAGSWIRFSDALIPYLGLEYNSLRLGITYDINTSQLKTASNSRGGFEISLIYIQKPPESKGLPCPKF
jgi:type IX secretion system PorP/SprF family membrane protein